jgi:hypothetical protein
LQKIEIMIKSVHAPIGTRFHQEACAYPWEFNTSFMPPRMKVAIGDGNVTTDVEATDHISVCS